MSTLVATLIFKKKNYWRYTFEHVNMEIVLSKKLLKLLLKNTTGEVGKRRWKYNFRSLQWLQKNICSDSVLRDIITIHILWKSV